mgnify:FL=1
MIGRKTLICLLTIVLIMASILAYTITLKKPIKTTSYIETAYTLKPIPYVEIYVLNDNYEYDDFLSDWGVSFLVRTPNNTFLFDTGPSAHTLLYNTEKLGLNLSNVEFIVISHSHGDHTGGLEGLGWMLKGRKVYIPSGAGYGLSSWIENLGFEVVKVNETTVIAPGVAIIGELYGPPWEQALAIYVENKGLIILTGCSHPGVENIVEKATKELNIKPYLVIGGFHLAGASESRIRNTISKLLALGVKKICPIHCSGDRIREILANNYPEVYGDGHVGLILKIGKEE